MQKSTSHTSRQADATLSKELEVLGEIETDLSQLLLTVLGDVELTVPRREYFEAAEMVTHSVFEGLDLAVLLRMRQKLRDLCQGLDIE
jgi:hypothetical protein